MRTIESTYPEVVEGEVCQPHSGDVFGKLIQGLRILCLERKEEIKLFYSHEMLIRESEEYISAARKCNLEVGFSWRVRLVGKISLPSWRCEYIVLKNIFGSINQDDQTSLDVPPVLWRNDINSFLEGPGPASLGRAWVGSARRIPAPGLYSNRPCLWIWWQCQPGPFLPAKLSDAVFTALGWELHLEGRILLPKEPQAGDPCPHRFHAGL